MFFSMDSWLKQSLDNSNKRTPDNVEAAVRTSANWVFANVLEFCTQWVPLPCYYFFSIE